MSAPWHLTAAEMDAEWDKMRADNERLRGLLRRYGGHEHDCEGTAGYLDPRCTCGFSAALGTQADQPPGGDAIVDCDDCGGSGEAFGSFMCEQCEGTGKLALSECPTCRAVSRKPASDKPTEGA